MNALRFFTVLLFSTSLSAQVNVIEVFKKTDAGPAFDGSMAPSEIVSEMNAEKLAKEEGELKVEVSIPVVTNKKVLAQDISGLPSVVNSAGEMADEVVVTIPFYYDAKTTSFEDYLHAMDNVLENLKQASQNKSSSHTCGGFPLVSALTPTWSSSKLCTQIKTTVTCMVGAHNRANWFITEQVVSAPAGCFIQP
jgi:hypothetical protein